MILNEPPEDDIELLAGSTFADLIQAIGSSHGLTVEQMANIALYALKSAGCYTARLHDEGDPEEYVLSVYECITESDKSEPCTLVGEFEDASLDTEWKACRNAVGELWELINGPEDGRHTERFIEQWRSVGHFVHRRTEQGCMDCIECIGSINRDLRKHAEDAADFVKQMRESHGDDSWVEGFMLSTRH